ncbi:MAG: DNA repair protein RecO [Candidatus Omnitrophica bacterium]|nr:DNA repair protein RecO [Candidatus Omnitrophota bacterium]
MPIQKSEGIILNKRDLRETSLVVCFYTRDFGKINGVLKGIRQDPSKFASTLEIFSNNEIIFYTKRNSALHLVSACDLKNNFDLIRKDIHKVGIASMMTELTAKLMPQEDKNEEVFNLLLSCLNELENTYDADKIATIFKIKLLALSGFKPHLDSCVSCGRKILDQSWFSLNLGGLLCLRCQQKDTTSRLIFRGTIASILHIEKNDIKNNLKLGMNPQIKNQLNAILNAFLNFHLDKELNSEKVINKLSATYFDPLYMRRVLL